MNCEKKHIGYVVGLHYHTEQLLARSGSWCKYGQRAKLFNTELEATKFINKYKSSHSEALYFRKYYRLIYK